MTDRLGDRSDQTWSSNHLGAVERKELGEQWSPGLNEVLVQTAPRPGLLNRPHWQGTGLGVCIYPSFRPGPCEEGSLAGGKSSYKTLPQPLFYPQAKLALQLEGIGLIQGTVSHCHSPQHTHTHTYQSLQSSQKLVFWGECHTAPVPLCLWELCPSWADYWPCQSYLRGFRSSF